MTNESPFMGRHDDRIAFRMSKGPMLANKRSRSAEFYLNGRCLIWAAAHGRFKKVPFFLHHLWAAVVS
jgi:hypothetical protein